MPTLSREGCGEVQDAICSRWLAPIGATAVKARPPRHHEALSVAGLHSALTHAP